MFEQIKPMYYNQERLVKPPQILYRTDISGHRYYYNIADNGICETFPSVTTVLSKTMPTSEFLIKWIADYGKARAEALAKQKADYGTLMHICFSSYLLQRTFDPQTIPARIQTFKASNGIDYDTSHWERELINDIASFHKFAVEHQITPIAIEVMLSSKKYGIAGSIDAVVEMTIGSGKANCNILKTDYDPKKGIDKRQRVIAIIDWKSGKKGFYDNHEAQLQMYEALWSERYPEFKPHKLFNWAPVNWENEPTFKLKDQTDSIQAKQWQLYIQIFNNAENSTVRKTIKQINGVLRLGQEASISEVGFETAVTKIHKIQKAEMFIEQSLTPEKNEDAEEKAITKIVSKETPSIADPIEELENLFINTKVG